MIYSISSLFARSPVKPLQTHMEAVQACIRELIPFFEAVLAGDWEEAAQVQGQISRLEREADRLKKDLRLHLPKSLFLPVSRRDLLETLTMQDNIANKAKDIAGLIIGRRMAIPAFMGEPILEYLRRCLDAAAQAQTAVNELDELVETGFRGQEVELVESMLQRLDEIEADTDRLQVRLRSQLLEHENDLPPVDVMFLYKIIEWVGDLADLAQRVGSRLQLMLAR